jgi:hypothetical protein
MAGSVVACYAGARYPERPRAFLWQERWLVVEQVEREWRTQTGLMFRVSTADNRRFTLTYDASTDVWSIQPVTAT